jgi:hypothetical protein
LTRLTILLLVAVAALVVGCGGSDNSKSDNSKSGGSDGGAESTASAGNGSEAGSETGSEANEAADSESETTSSGSSLSKQEFVKQANQICKVGAETALAFESTDPQASEKEYMPEMIEVSIVPRFRDVVDQIEALGVPSGDEVPVEEFLEALTQGVDELESDPGSYASIPDVEKTLHPASDKAKAYTLTSCAFG